MCSIAEYFYELCCILTSPQGESKYKQRVHSNKIQTTVQNTNTCTPKTASPYLNPDVFSLVSC